MWTLDQSLVLIRRMQRSLFPLGFHVALAGGVLNNGESIKDLDLVFIPLTNEEAPDAIKLLEYLETLGWKVDNNLAMSHTPNPYTPFREQFICWIGDQRIDVFVL